MAEITEVGVVAGVPSSGTGEVPTLAPVRDELIDANALLTLIEAVTTAVKDATANALKTLLVDSTGAPLETEGDVTIKGDLPQGDADTAPFPIPIGGDAVAHGANPTAHAAGDRIQFIANRHRIPFHIGGHPNIVTKAHLIADSDGAQTDLALIGTISAGTKIVLTRVSAVCDNANSGDCVIVIGFGATNTPVADLDGTVGVVVNGSFDGGAGITVGDGSGIVAIGGDGEELRITCSDPVAGNVRVSYSYYTIES